MNFLDPTDAMERQRARTDETIPWPSWSVGNLPPVKPAAHPLGTELDRIKFEAFCIQTNRFSAEEFLIDRNNKYSASIQALFVLWQTR